jgi:dTDP-4-dehydrorhamnose 3,5-epimerase
MKFLKQEIEGVWLIEAEPTIDTRGVFRRHYCQEEYYNNGLQFRIAQTNISQNPKKHTLRGFHYQVKPFEENKILACLQGFLYVVIVDLRSDSNTFLKYISIELSSRENLSLHVPTGCASGYLTLEDSTIILYYMSEFFDASSYRGFRYNDPSFLINWPFDPQVISSKDQNYPDLDLKIFDK